jgi:protein involved in polysaccharide export with SLBB domain
MFKQLSWGFLLLALMAALPGLAQDDYIVGERDVLSIQVMWEQDMTATVTVSANGTITYWYLGEIPVNGLSVQQVKQKIHDLLANGYLINPVVGVKVTEYRAKEVQIQGAVIKPGTYSLDTNSVTMIKLIALASGVDANRIGSYAYIIRGSAEKLNAAIKEQDVASMANRITVDLNKLLNQGDLNEDKPIYGGDFVLIASRDIEDVKRNYIWIAGEVRTPGKLPYQEGLTALAVVIQAGGWTDLGSPNHATISRTDENGKNEVIRVKLKDIRGGKRPDVLLKPGDRITVPQSLL